MNEVSSASSEIFISVYPNQIPLFFFSLRIATISAHTKKIYIEKEGLLVCILYEY